MINDTRDLLEEILERYPTIFNADDYVNDFCNVADDSLLSEEVNRLREQNVGHRYINEFLHKYFKERFGDLR